MSGVTSPGGSAEPTTAPTAEPTAELTAEWEAAALAHLIPDEIVAVTEDLIRGRGENPGETEADSVRRLADHCTRIGARVSLQEVAPGRANLRAELGPETGEPIVFLGHSDVVPAGDGWHGDPFEPRREGGAIIGRGSTDMKGGLAAVLAAMRAVNLVRPDLRMELLCTVDEEDLATGVIAYTQAAPKRPLRALIVAEPTDLRAVIGCRGATNLTLTITGASAHAGRPEDGASAILAAGQAIEAVRDAHAAAAPTGDALLGAPSWNVGTIAGGSATSMVARECVLSLDRRTLPGERADEILAGLLADVTARVRSSGIAGAERVVIDGRVDMVMPGFRTDPAAELPSIAAGVLAELGLPDELSGWTAACEGGFLAEHHGVPTIILGPGDLNEQAHQPEERVLVADLVTAAQAYVMIMLRLGERPATGHTSFPTPRPANSAP